MAKLTDSYIKYIVLNQYPNSKIIDIYRVLTKSSSRIYVKFTCGICGNECDAYFDNIKKGRGCKKCGINKRKRIKYTTDYICRELYNMGFIWLNKNEYKTTEDILVTQCTKCGKVSKSNVTNRIVSKRKCKKCAGYEKTLDELKQEIFELVGCEYDVLSEKYYNAYSELRLKHKTCGNEYTTTAHSFLAGRRCPICNASKGEGEIAKILDFNNIEYFRQYRFEECKLHLPLPFDFYIPKHNVCIEYDGEQHYHIIEYFGGYEGFVTRVIRDTIKNIYCENNNIKLIRISYLEFDDINNILTEQINNI